MPHRNTITAVVLLLAALLASSATAEIVQTSGTASCTGGRCACATAAGVFTLAQLGPTGVSISGSYTHYGGFIGTAPMRPGTTNAQGIALELDPDNDDDGLTDEAEVTGSAFGGHASSNPNADDSDGDGMSDGDEADGMYDPNDPGHRLAIVSAETSGGMLTLTWIGKGGGTVNRIQSSDSPGCGTFTNTIHSAAYTGGAYPWFKATNTHSWVQSPAGQRFFCVVTE